MGPCSDSPRARRAFALLLSAVSGVGGLGVGCSDDEAGAPRDVGPADGASPDASDAGPVVACREPTDAGPVLVACDPTDGTRCELSTGTRCVLDVTTDEGDCVCLTDRLGFQASCTPGEPVCAPGFACFGVMGGPGPVCQKVCDFEAGTGCEEIDESGVEAFECAGLAGPDGAPADYGLCVFVGQACNLLDNDCPDDQTCTITGLQTACVDVGNQALGQPCDLSARCQRDLVCVQTRRDRAPVCNAVCDPDAVEDPCPVGQRCRAFDGLEGGVCSG